MLRVAIFDLDGVVRQYDPVWARSVADRHGLTVEQLYTGAFAPELGGELVIGKLTRAAWVERVGVRVGSPAAAAEWLSDIGQVDADVLALIRALRTRSIPVAILTNGTDVIEAELTRLGIWQDFDLVVSTWDIGVAKPDAGAFEAVCTRLGVAPSEAFFTDDVLANVVAAAALGLQAHHFTGAPALRAALVETGLLA
jgi:HAD superfamily hydrolase (TIGR01509 family)